MLEVPGGAAPAQAFEPPADGEGRVMGAPATSEAAAIVRWADDPGNDRRRGRSAESRAAEFLLEHRHGARRHSITSGARLLAAPGMPSEDDVDFEGTCHQVAKALEVLPAMWRPAVLVAAGWRVGVRGLRDPAPRGGPPYLVRAGFSPELPQGFCRAALASFTRTFREALFARGLVRQGVEARPAAPTAVRYVDPDVLEGRDAIAFHAGCTVRTVQRWIAEGAAPIRRTPSGRVWARASELDGWLRGGEIDAEGQCPLLSP